MINTFAAQPPPLNSPGTSVVKGLNDRQHGNDKMLPIPIPLPASFSTISNETTISRPNILQGNTIPSSFGRGPRVGRSSDNGHNSINRRIPTHGYLQQDTHQNIQHYRQSTSHHQPQTHVDWMPHIESVLPKPSQESDSEPSGSKRISTEHRKSSESRNMDHNLHIQQNPPHNSNTSISPPLHQSNFSNPQIAALAAAAAYHPLWPTYRAAAAAAAAAAQAQIAAAAASAVSNASTQGASAFSIPSAKTTVNETPNIFSNSVSNLSHSMAGTSNAVDTNLTPYIPAFHTSFDSSSMEGNFTRQSEPVTASPLFTPYHPYHLAAAAAFVSSQMVEFQRSLSASQSTVPTLVPSASQEENMPSSTTQEHFPSISDEGANNSKTDDKVIASPSVGGNERRCSPPVAKRRCSKNPYSIDEILREEQNSTRNENVEMYSWKIDDEEKCKIPKKHFTTHNNSNAQKQSNDCLLVKQNNTSNKNETKDDMNITPSNLINENINECSLPNNKKEIEIRVVMDNDNILKDISYEKEDDSVSISNNSKNSYVLKRETSATDDEDVPKTEKTRDLLFTD